MDDKVKTMSRHKIWTSERISGINRSPAATGNWAGAAELRNIDLNEIGRMIPREGYVSSDETMHRDGDRIHKMHYLGAGDRAPYSLLFRHTNDESVAISGERIFIAQPSEITKWIDAVSFREYELGISEPAQPVTDAVRVDYPAEVAAALREEGLSVQNNNIYTAKDILDGGADRGTFWFAMTYIYICLLYTSPSPRDS